MTTESPLQALGISREEEKAYEFLLANPGTVACDFARRARWTAQKAGRVLKALEAKGMANRLPEKTPRYFPTPPEIVVDLLTTKRHDEIQRARVTAQRWQAKVRPASTDEQPIEIINGREAIARRFEHLHQSAREEIVCMERPPYVVSPMHTYENVQKQAMERGVLLRNIVDASVLDMPGKPEALRKDVEEGEHIRVLARMPMKLVIADRRTALVPLTLEQARDIALVLRPSLLLDALYELFEILWDRATPFGTAAVSVHLSGKVRHSVDADRLVTLLAAGMNDKSIAQELGISARTLERRITEVVTLLEARTRFQAGWLAALRTQSSGDARRKR
ncbi:MAG: helix-turn-helix domain-containing protein [Dokdonella sp.]|uniref:helix-turn-helix domain-containing protein n=1 Tax=Dokdonella sp. TaxID=2291710 RepID=UPI00326526BA